MPRGPTTKQAANSTLRPPSEESCRANATMAATEASLKPSSQISKGAPAKDTSPTMGEGDTPIRNSHAQ
ncbi:MAG: hypothetical protein KH015_06455 [Gordonibacter pamelaeae]|uniref:Uncharacterized protein n=1 Tax=Gordonibacter pamelaeae TaxID=471189 RepID=A0A369M2M3_9ACTN|nr:hypothetical protein [Gordonibacter pamelaeae]MBS4895407.1 hypothetical protein [Gordonibacter pamelaeae]RDB65664.1 hypothetical protein C1877_05985 [Gordonibacter pamelaeae]HJH74797.1 hypothetical protein [Eggerthellaceae bacterium]